MVEVLEARTTILRVLRCLCVSVGTTVLSGITLVTLAVGFGVPAGAASFIANGCGIPASYLGNRRWVWRRSGRGDLAREVVPFWILSLAGLVASTLFVSYVGTITAAMPATGRAIALPAASVGVFATLWIVQFVLLDRVIFRSRTQTRDTVAVGERSASRSDSPFSNSGVDQRLGGGRNLSPSRCNRSGGLSPRPANVGPDRRGDDNDGAEHDEHAPERDIPV
ncbi:MAG: hypothetical protein QOG50_3487 [Actinomycetota bacterium]|nr:hypothetical protein [Actinomycetota bacterium]